MPQPPSIANIFGPSPSGHPGRPHEAPRGTRDASELLRAAFERLPIAVLLADPSGVVVLANREVERVFGYAENELLGQPIDLLVPGVLAAGQDPGRELLQQALAPAAPRELFGRRKDGSEVGVELSLTPLHIRDRELVLASVTDRTARHGQPHDLRDAAGERLEFESLVGELGAEFVNLPADELDRRIEDALGRIVRTLGLDRSALFQVDEASGEFVYTHHWSRPGWAAPLPRLPAKDTFPWLLGRLRAGEVVSFASPEEVPDATDRENLRRLGTRSSVMIPLSIGDRTLGAVTFATMREPRAWTPEILNRLQVVALVFTNALARRQGDDALRRAVDETASLRDRLRQENEYLRHELKALTDAPAIVGHTAAMRRVLEQVKQVAPTNSTVLIVGETGTGKTLLAARIHELSARSERALVRVSCAALSAAWLERELFGSENGAYADAEFRRLGRVELASGSTLLLDEVADLPIETQAILARMFQEQQVKPNGNARVAPLDLRIIATTRRELPRAIQQGAFRDDLYYSLNAFPIRVPPLRERPDDIPLLVWRFVDEFSQTYGRPVDAIDQSSMTLLQRHTWPGNARELRNVVERAVILAGSRRLHVLMPPDDPAAARGGDTLAAIEREHIAAILAGCDGRIPGKRGAASRLGLTPRVLRAKMSALGLHPTGRAGRAAPRRSRA